MELIDKFLEFEDKNSLLEKRLDDFRYWGYIRWGVWREIESKINGTADSWAQVQEARGNGFVKRIKQVLTAYRRSPMRRQNTCDILFLNHERRMLLDGEYTPIYFYALIEELTSSYGLLEPRNIYGEHYKPEKFFENTYYLDEFSAVAKVYKMFHKWMDTKVFTELADILSHLEIEFGVKINKEFWIGEFYRLKNEYFVGRKYFRKVLERLKPRCIVEVVHYNPLVMMINETAHGLGIPVFELQHGVMGYNHIAYNYLNKCKLPSLPDKILLYSDFWKIETRFPLEDRNILAMGYPHMERMVKKYSTKSNKNNLVILFISQRTIGKMLSQFAISLSEALEKEGIEYKIIYKLHPNEVPSWKTDLPWLVDGRNNIEVIDNTARDIYDFYSAANIQIGVNSTGLYEGLAFNLKTFILKAPGSRNVKTLYENGYATLVEYPMDVIKHLYKKGVAGDNFWKLNSVENILKLISPSI